MNEVATTTAGVVEKVVVQGDLSSLNPAEKVTYYNGLCESLGLNPLTRPFAILKLNGKEVMYAQKDATDQLRALRGVSVTDLETREMRGVYLVVAKGHDKTGRTDAATGAVTVGNLTGDALANALMKAETKAKRRLTLSLCGLGMFDETEIETVPGVQPETRTVMEPPAERPADQITVISQIKDIVDTYGIEGEERNHWRRKVAASHTVDALRGVLAELEAAAKEKRSVDAAADAGFNAGAGA